MQIIKINVNENHINMIDIKEVYSDSYKYNTCIFIFDKSWENYNNKIASFIFNGKVYTQSIVDNQCIIHPDVLKKGHFNIGIYGNKVEEEKLVERNTTNLIPIEVSQGGYFKDSLDISEEDIKAYDIYISKMNNIYSNIKEEHKDAIEDINNKEIDVKRNIDEYTSGKIQEYNDNTDIKIKEYNNNAKLKTEEFNNDYKAKKKEVDQVAEDVAQNKTDIEEIEKRVKESEQNANMSEINAKTSEGNAQKSAESASKTLTDITTIQEDINKSKGEINTAKESIDKSVENVEKLVDEATNQANISKEQADISTTNAGQTSTDKSAVETMKSEVSTMKSSVEQNKSDTEQIKNDTQGIYNDTVDAKNETLQAKTEVENSLENERIESDKKYANAIESDVITVEEFEQVELDQDGYMKDFSAEGNLPEITQETHEPTDNILYSGEQYWEKGSLNSSTGQPSESSTRLRTKDFVPIDELDSYYTSVENINYRWLNIHYYDIDKNFIRTQEQISNINGSTSKIVTPPQNTKFIKAIIRKLDNSEIDISDVSIAKPMIVKGTTKIDYVEGYPIMPSLNYPSPFKNVVKNVPIQNSQENIVYIDNQDYKPGYTITKDGIKFSIQDDLGLKCVGTSTIGTAIPILGIFSNRFEEKMLIPKGNKLYSLIKNDDNNGGRIVMFSNNSYTVVNNLQSPEITEDLSVGYIYAEIVANKTVDCVIYPQLTYEKVDKFKPYNGYNENLELFEGQFLGNFEGFENYTENNKLKGNLKILTLTGDENWTLASEEQNTIRFRYNLNGHPMKIDTTNQKVLYMCNYFKSFVGSERLADKEGIFITKGSSNDEIYIRVPISKYPTIASFKAELKEKYESGNPVQVLYITDEEFEDDLSTENTSKINSLKTYKEINNIYCKDCKISFKVNRDIKKVIEENNTKEREISDSKYAEALKGIVENEQNVQIYAQKSKAKNLVIKGKKITQKTRQGYNIFKPFDGIIEQRGLTLTSQIDGGIKITGTNTQAVNIILTNNNIPCILSGGKTYTRKIIVDGIIEKGGKAVVIPGRNIENSNIMGDLHISSNGVFSNSIEIETEQNVKGISLYVSGEGVLFNCVIYIMIYEGEEDKPFEQYGASPSLDFQSEIEATTEQNIDINKGNIVNPNGIYLFNSNKYIGTKPAYNEAPMYSIEPNTEYAIISNDNVGDAKFYGWKNGKSTQFTLTNKSSLYNKSVRTFNSGENTQLSFFVGGFATETPNVFQTFENINDFLEKTEFMIIKASYIKNGVLPEYRPYKGKEYKLVLPEGKFNGAIEGYYDKIYSDDKQEKIIEEIIFTGTEAWKINSQDDTGIVFMLSFSDYFVNNVGLSNYFSITKNIYGEKITILNKTIYIAINKSKVSTLNEFKNLLAELYQNGKPVKIYVVRTESSLINLPEGTVPKIELMDDLNDISIDEGTFSFEYNKSLVKVLEEKDEKIDNLENRVLQLESLLITPSTSSMLINNLANDLESEVE